MLGGAKVLVLMTSPLDKIVHALRVVESIKRERPELEFTWVVRRFYEPLVASFPFVDRTIVFQRSEALLRFASVLRAIRQERYDFVLDFEGHARTGAMCFFARAERKIGLATAREGATIAYGEVVKPKVGESGHMIEQVRALASVFDVDAEVRESLVVPSREPLPPAIGARPEGARVCIFPGRFKSKRAWSGVMKLAESLVEKYAGIQVLLLGLLPSVCEKVLHERILDFQSELSWSQICRAIADSDLVLANDNGPAQLAGALGVRNVTLYSYVSPEVRGSYPVGAPENVVLRAPNGDVEQLDEEWVLEAVEKLLDL